MSSLSSAITKDRQERGLTQEQLSKLTGIPYQSITKWERGLTMPRDVRLDQLSVFFGAESSTSLVAQEIKSVRISTRRKGRGMNAELAKIKKKDVSFKTYNLPGIIAYDTDFYVSNEGYIVIEQECDGMRISLTPEQLERFVNLIGRNGLLEKAYRARMEGQTNSDNSKEV